MSGSKITSYIYFWFSKVIVMLWNLWTPFHLMSTLEMRSWVSPLLFTDKKMVAHGRPGYLMAFIK